MQEQKIQKMDGKSMDMTLAIYVSCAILFTAVMTKTEMSYFGDFIFPSLILELCCIIQFFILLKKTLKLHSYFLFPFTFLFPLIYIFQEILKINVPEFLLNISIGLIILKTCLILDIMGLFTLCRNDKNQIKNVSKNFLIRIPLLVGCAVLFFLGLYLCIDLSYGWEWSNRGVAMIVAPALLFYLIFPTKNFS